uniref:uncharacterized protein LOC105352410 n=1 Tax=Fragaria vesca subsp. vesca TaxID=101020 RepID=UPI0005CA86AF|nr:PREDICTED: uncharacterized protein LOC105352410 [Fragaria vesca subsp. vesca]XP_011467785.1 PREDICTED: uncharacterized protein LOC105352410 [Fragaria vesca subsp. vesca]
MAATVVTSANSSILEVLNLYNYEDWSLRVETFLIAEGLWDAVKATAQTPNNGETDPEWSMKNAKALHAIQNSCRTDVFGFICDIRMAKDAWETLANRLKPKNRDIKGMAATLVPSTVIDLEALDQDNYEHWSYWVRKYLLAENLWDVVQGTSEPPKLEDGEGEAEYMAWRKNNARALHVITIFSGQDARYCISDSEMAEDAWITLAKKFNPPQSLKTPEEDSEDLNDDIDSNDGDPDLEIGYRANDDEYDTFNFFENVRNGKWEAAKEFINKHPDAVRAKDQRYGWTALQFAVYRVRVDFVKELLPLMKKKDLNIADKYGRNTALSLAIQNSDTKDAVEIVKCIVGRT